MAPLSLTTHLGELGLRSPLIAASGTVGSVWEWAEIADVSWFGAAVAKSVALSPWPGRPTPRMSPTSVGMLNGIGIQNPGIDQWASTMSPRIPDLAVPVWGSAVGGEAAEFAKVAERLAATGVTAVELNLSCPNLDDGEMFSFSAERSAEVVHECVGSASVPIGAKLSPNTPDVVAVSAACVEAGASFVTLTNTVLGFGIDVESRRPLLHGGIGGYSGPGIKPFALRCVFEVARELPGVPVVGCGGVRTAHDVLEYLMAGASAVAMGTTLLEKPNAGARIGRDLIKLLDKQGYSSVSAAVGSVEPW